MSDLDTIRKRLQIVLMDLNEKSWDSDALDESIRLALMDIGFSIGAELFIDGLQQATKTTLASIDTGALVTGAAGYAAAARSVDLAEKVSAGGVNSASVLRDYAKAQLLTFAAQLERIRQRSLHTAATAPHQAMAWIERPPNFEGYGDTPQPSTPTTPPADNTPPVDDPPDPTGDETLERESRNLTTTIFSGAAVSAVIDSTWAASQGLVTPAALEATSKIAFKVAANQGDTFLPLYDENNTLVEVTATLNAARAYALPDKLFAWPYFKLWTEASGVDVLQTADRVFTITQKS